MKAFKKKNVLLVILSLILILAGIFIRVKNLPYQSGDYTYYHITWMNHMRDHGIFNSFGTEFSNYAPLYLHILSVASYYKLNYLIYIKVVSFLFELLCCFYVYKLIRLKFNAAYSFFSAAAVFLLPTVVMNGSQWGQCDIIYSSFVIGSIYYLLINKQALSIIFLGIAIAFKQQALFIFPFYLALFLNKTIPFYKLLYLPIPYIVSILPSFFAGRPFAELLFLYLRQDNPRAREAVVNAPTIFNYFSVPEETFPYFKFGGIVLTVIAVFVTLLIFRKLLLNSNYYLLIALLVSLMVPFFLPRMHERYFMIAELLSVIYVLYFKKEYWLPVLIFVPSVVTYTNYFYRSYYLAYPLISSMLLLAIAVLMFDGYRELKKSQGRIISSIHR